MSRTLKNSLHAHGCTNCHVRYQDACADVAVDARCIKCRGGRPWQLLIDNAAPQDCCRRLSRLVTKAEKATYSLAGGHLWHICPDCKRTHPTSPRRTP
jgi:hypothetical protein